MKGTQTMVWYIDPHHTQATFSVKHMMVSTVRGRLGKLRGEIEIDPENPHRASFEIGADVTAIDTGDARRDGHLRSADFFHAEKYPEIVFKSAAIFPKGENRFAVSGDLTIRDVTRPVIFDVELEGIGVDGNGGRHLGASATITLDREGLRPGVEPAGPERRARRRQGEGGHRTRGSRCRHRESHGPRGVNGAALMAAA